MSTFEFEKLIVDIADYPEPGVTFKDITPLLGSAEGLCAVVSAITEHFSERGITKVMGTEARGFMLGAPVAYDMGVGFVPARKAGKLPRKSFHESYGLEYGTDTLEIHQDAFDDDDIVLIVDDLVATGGTALASVRLVEQAGAKLEGLAFLLELESFDPRARLGDITDAEFFSLVQVETY